MYQFRSLLRVVAALSVFIPTVSPAVCAVLKCGNLRDTITTVAVATHDHSSHCVSAINDGSWTAPVLSGVYDCDPSSDMELVQILDADYVLPSFKELVPESRSTALHAAEELRNTFHRPPELLPPRA
jgi:hypothetical protein